MGRKRKEANESVDIHARNGEHPMFTEVLKAAAEDNDPLIGLPLPSLAARYLLQANIFPLSRFIQLRGEFSAGKSAFLIEIMRWFHVYGGGAIMIDTENKGSPTMMSGLFGHNQQYMARTKVTTAASVEEWQKKYMGFCQAIHKQIDAENAPDRVIPICIGVDSISAVEVDRRVEKVADEGHAAALSHCAGGHKPSQGGNQLHGIRSAQEVRSGRRFSGLLPDVDSGYVQGFAKEYHRRAVRGAICAYCGDQE